MLRTSSKTRHFELRTNPAWEAQNAVPDPLADALGSAPDPAGGANDAPPDSCRHSGAGPIYTCLQACVRAVRNENMLGDWPSVPDKIPSDFTKK